ncbi:MAG: hypothetical protein R3234_12575, partial [Thermoanaerobaculia bacterium]|nr:hypothetical protein [Thermoanaerobaculia bacterium]
MNALEFHRELYDYTPSGPVNLFLEDFSDFGHGGATTVPTNFINIGIAPFSYVYDTIPAIDRMFWMANHEMAHIVTMDQAAGRDLIFRRLFGGKVEPVATHPESILYNYLTNPRWNAPRWYHEGIAVFLETWMSGGLGRVLGAYDEMVFRTKIRDDTYFYDVVGLESEGTTIDFQVGVNAYLYGTRFMSYMALQYGPEKLIEWTARRPGSAPYFTDQFERVYGTSLQEAWDEWIEWERQWQERNLEALGENPITEFQPLSTTPLGSVSRAFLDRDRGKIYVGVRSTGQLARILALDLETGETEPLAEVQGAALFYVTSLAHDETGDRLFFTTDNYGWRDLWVLDLETGQRRRLMKDARIGDLAFDPSTRSLWGVRHFNGISTLVRIPEPWEEWNQVYSWPYGKDAYDIDVAPDGSLVTGSLAEIDGSQSLIALEVEDLLEGTYEPTTLFDFEVSSPSNFVFSPDGRYLYGSSTYSGVSNVYRWDFQEDDMDILTNAETGYFRPVPYSEEEVVAFRYTGDGLTPGLVPNRALDTVGAIQFLGNAIVDRHPIVEEWQVEPPRRREPETTAPYATLENIQFNTIYPVVEGYKDSAAAGVHLDLSDPLNLSGLELTVSWSPDDELEDDERLHARALFHHWSWEVTGTYNRADFYDLFGPTETSRRGYSLGVGYSKTLVYDEPRRWSLNAEVEGWGDLETLPDAQNVRAGTDELVDVGLTLEYENVQRSLGAVEAEEEGIRWSLFAGGRYAQSETFPRIHSELDVGWQLPLDHSSLWIRTSAGGAFGDAEDPFSNFFFGAFGNNYVDHRRAKRYRDYYSFPGVEINEIGGRTYGKLMAEWTLPPVRFRHVGWPGFYLTWARTALFSTVLGTDPDDDALSETFYDVGIQIDLKLVLFSNLRSTLSLGYARAWDEDDRSSDEVL